MGIVQIDPQEVQRENEALQRVVAQTSKYARPNSRQDKLQSRNILYPAAINDTLANPCPAVIWSISLLWSTKTSHPPRIRAFLLKMPGY